MAKIKLCINGDRECNDLRFLLEAVKHFNIDLENVKEIVSGKARGGDELGEILAKQKKIKVKEFPAKWDDIKAVGAKIKVNKFGKEYNTLAGFNRNQEMADYADAVLCLQPSGPTSGSDDCVKRFEKLGKPTYVYYGKEDENKTKKKYVF